MGCTARTRAQASDPAAGTLPTKANLDQGPVLPPGWGAKPGRRRNGVRGPPWVASITVEAPGGPSLAPGEPFLMADAHGNPVLRYIRQLAAPGPGVGAVTDADALRRFVTDHDEAAFELLVWRHGAVVSRVCRGVLRDVHAAEDAFQGTFLVLARKAGAVSGRASLAGWLYRVAYRIALRAQAQARKRAAEGPEPLDGLADPSAGDPADLAARRELHPLVYAEVNRLPP